MGMETAIHFGTEFDAKQFVGDHPKLAGMMVRVEAKEFTETDLLDFEGSYEMHMRRKKQEPPKP